ncbi:uncharacterized protein [Petaurus breviceps papuanus]|uniref:uncharacterized protein isoform X2 n=1 Tax=Petaurus breviceps papuanus TaxID=3040969 RepID=UPI0036DACACB
MNRFPLHIWVCFWFLSMESLLHISFVSSAPVNSYNSSKKIIKRILDMDEKVFEVKDQFVPNSTNPGHINGKTDMGEQHMVPSFKKTFSVTEPGNNSKGRIWFKKGDVWKDTTDTDMDMDRTYSEPDEHLKDRSPEKKGINWEKEVLSFGCLSLLFALTGGAALWLTIYTHLNREETRELDNLAEKLVPLPPPRELDRSDLKKPHSKETEKERESKSILHSVLKTERKKKRHKKRRLVSRLNLTRREMFGKVKRSESLGVNTQDRKISSLSKQIGELQKMLEKENHDGEKMQDANG